MKNNEKVSIVIPVFNGEKYIENCINSLIIQTYKDIEIIIVDDGSIDNTGNIVKKMVNLDNRIIYIYQKNSGVSSARNNGIKGSSGKYITFVDSDDSVQKNYVEYLHSLINIDNADIALTRYPKKFKSNTRIKNNKKMQDDNVEIVTGVSAANEMLCYKIVISPWNKMFKKEILIKNNILFNQNLSFGEGFEFVINSFLHSNKVVIGNKKIYNYRVDNMNSVMTKFSRKLVTGSIDSQKSILKLINNNTKYEDNIFLHKAWKYSNWHTSCDCLNTIIGCNAKTSNIDLYKLIKKTCRKDALLALDLDIPKKDKIKSIMYFISPYFTAKFINKFRTRKYNKENKVI